MTQTITLNNIDEKGPFIELVNYVKLVKNLGTGGQAKLLIKEGTVLVNGIAETRVKRKIREGDRITVDGKQYKA